MSRHRDPACQRGKVAEEEVRHGGGTHKYALDRWRVVARMLALAREGGERGVPPSWRLGPRIDDSGANMLAGALMRNRTLAKLCLRENHIGDEGAEAPHLPFAALPGHAPVATPRTLLERPYPLQPMLLGRLGSMTACVPVARRMSWRRAICQKGRSGGTRPTFWCVLQQLWSSRRVPCAAVSRIGRLALAWP